MKSIRLRNTDRDQIAERLTEKAFKARFEEIETEALALMTDFYNKNVPEKEQELRRNLLEQHGNKFVRNNVGTVHLTAYRSDSSPDEAKLNISSGYWRYSGSCHVSSSALNEWAAKHPQLINADPYYSITSEGMLKRVLDLRDMTDAARGERQKYHDEMRAHLTAVKSTKELGNLLPEAKVLLPHLFKEPEKPPQLPTTTFDTFRERLKGALEDA